jgi:hypothetical protein
MDPECEDDDEEGNAADEHSGYHFLLNLPLSDSIPAKDNPMITLAPVVPIEGYDLVGRLPRPEFVRPIRRLGDIFRLPKLWRSRSIDVLADPMEQSVLSHLQAYADVVVETRRGWEERPNETAVHRSVLLHALIHIVRARLPLLPFTRSH